MSRPTILLCDDHTLVVEGLRKLLEPDFDVVGSVENGNELLNVVDKLNPDVILLDILMPVLNGIDATRQLKKRGVRAKIIMVTMCVDADYVREAFRAGASGYVIKRAAGSELVTALRQVLSGHYYLTPLVSKGTITAFLSENASGIESSGLTLRQRQVLQLIAEGHAGKSIASVLHISPKTVEYHKAGIMEHLGLRTVAELTRYAIAHGIVGKE
jgi:DNA-binding NarL/FixJ family response regulator